MKLIQPTYVNRSTTPTAISFSKPGPTPNPQEDVEQLEQCGGNINCLLVQYRGLEAAQEKEEYLFKLYSLLIDLPELLKRWNNAAALSAKIRLQLLQHKALKTLETFNSQTPKSSSPEISYANILLRGLLEPNQPYIPPSKTSEEPDELDKDFQMLSAEEPETT